MYFQRDHPVLRHHFRAHFAPLAAMRQVEPVHEQPIGAGNAEWQLVPLAKGSRWPGGAVNVEVTVAEPPSAEPRRWRPAPHPPSQPSASRRWMLTPPSAGRGLVSITISGLHQMARSILAPLERCPTSPAHTIRGVAQVRGAPVSVIPIVHSHKRGEPRAIYSGWRACGLVVSLPVFIRCDFMTSLEDCVAVSGLTEEEPLAIAEHEHLPDITATAYNKQQRSRDHCNVHCEDPRGL